MAFYEHVLLSRSDMSSQQAEALAAEVGGIVEQNGGSVAKSEYWGLRTLAYPIKKNRKAHYSMLGIEMPPSAVSELERQLRINEDVLRFLTIRVDEIDDAPSPVMVRRERAERRPAREGEARERDAEERDAVDRKEQEEKQ